MYKIEGKGLALSQNFFRGFNFIVYIWYTKREGDETSESDYQW